MVQNFYVSTGIVGWELGIAAAQSSELQSRRIGASYYRSTQVLKVLPESNRLFNSTGTSTLYSSVRLQNTFRI